MKTHTLWLAAVLALLLVSLPLCCAFADAIYPAPGVVQAGSFLDHLVATVGSGLSVTAMEGTLPEGVTLVTEESFEGVNVYLRGTPWLAGSYNCLFTVGEGASLSCPFTVVPATPSVSTTGNLSCYPNESAAVTVFASAADGGTLSYQWYYSQYGDNSTGSVIGGENRAELNVVAGRSGTSYYYCIVTNTNNGQQVSVASPVISVSVSQDSISGVSLRSLPFKLSYQVGDTLDTNGLQLSVSYASGNMDNVFSGFSVYPSQLSAAGEQLIEVYYEGFTCQFYVSVQEAAEVVTDIGVLSLPYKTSYTVGEALDTGGLTIRAYTNRGIRDVYSGMTCTPSVFTYAGSQLVTVSYGGKTCSFSVTVQEAQPAEQPLSLQVETMPGKTTYTVGETLDPSGLVLKQITNRQNSQFVYSGYQCSPSRLDTVGRQVITVQYGALSTSFTVTVTDVLPSPTSAPSPTPTLAPQPSPAASSAQTTDIYRSHQANIGRSLIAVIVVTSLVALAVLGVYVYIQNLGGFEEAEDRLRELLGKWSRRR